MGQNFATQIEQEQDMRKHLPKQQVTVDRRFENLHLNCKKESATVTTTNIGATAMASAMRVANVATMNKLEGFNVVIICCSSSLQAKYWQQRLEAGRGSVLAIDSVVLSVEEDWPGGAGNGKKLQCLQFSGK